MNENQAEYVTTTEAIRLLDVSKGKMAKLIKLGEIPYIRDPRNERAKLIKISDIEAWLAKAVRPKVPHHRRPSLRAISNPTPTSASIQVYPGQYDDDAEE